MEDINNIMIGDKEIKWTFGAMRTFEARARSILKKMDIRLDNYSTGAILTKYLKVSEILEAAVAASTGLSGVEGKKGEPSEASQAVDQYLGEGGALEELQKAVYMAYLEKNDPSFIPIWLENIARNEEAMKINQMKEEAKLEVARLELEADQQKIKELKLSGKQSIASGT
jgi:hypothetical protein